MELSTSISYLPLHNLIYLCCYNKRKMSMYILKSTISLVCLTYFESIIRWIESTIRTRFNWYYYRNRCDCIHHSSDRTMYIIDHKSSEKTPKEKVSKNDEDLFKTFWSIYTCCIIIFLIMFIWYICLICVLSLFVFIAECFIHL